VRTHDFQALDIVRDPSNPGVFYAAAKNSNNQWRIFRSVDNGSSWNELGQQPGSGVHKKIAIAPEPNWKIFVAAENAGVFWKGPDSDPWHLSGPAEGLYDRLANSIGLDIRSTNFLVYASKTNVYVSVDFGNSWTPAVNGMRRVWNGYGVKSLHFALECTRVSTPSLYLVIIH
jgi:hypothetical protein